MSGMVIIPKGLSFSDASVGYAAPVPGNLEYLNFFGGSALLTRNLAAGKPQASVGGAPVVNEHSVTFTNLLGFIQTQVPHTEQMTLFAVARHTSPESENLIISNYTSPRAEVAGTSVGMSLMFRIQGAVDGLGKIETVLPYFSGDGGVVGATGGALIGAMPVGGVIAVSGQVNGPARSGATRNHSTNQTGVYSWAAPNVVDRGSPFRIGGGYHVLGNSQPVEIFHAAIWSGLLSADELQTHYAAVKSYYARRGIAV